MNFDFLNRGAMLAPMAGVTDMPFRVLCHEMGCPMAVSEMVSAKGYLLAPKDNRATRELLSVDERERGAVALQLFGHEPEIMARAAEKLTRDGRYALLDINMGCPVPKIVGNGEGSALMKEPVRAAEIVAAVAKASHVPVTVKMRLGFEAGSETYLLLGQLAQESGAQVLAIEKQARYGGTTALTSEIESINPPRIKELYNNGEDFCDADAMHQAWLDYVDGDAKPELIDLFFENCGPALDWLALDHGAQFDMKPQAGFTDVDVYKVKFQWLPNYDERNPQAPTYGYNKAEIATYFDRLVNDFTDLGGQYMLETEAYDLITENGKIVGAKAKNLVDGTEYTIHADAVVIATGGFLGSGEMTEKYLSDEYYPLKGTWKIYGTYGNDGKMLQAAIDDGAATYNIGMPPEVHLSGTIDFLPAHEYGYAINTIPDTLDFNTGRECRWTVADLPLMMGVSADSLAVGMDGKRFTSETGIAMLDPWIAGPRYFSIWSTEQLNSIVSDGLKTDVIGPAVGFLGHRGSIPSGTPLPEAFDVMNNAIERGFVYKADTIEELADMIGLDASALTETVAAYNGYCESGVDAEFGKDAALLTKIGEGPYYAIAMASYSYNTCAGLDVNEKMQVLDTNGSVMEGLFCVGSDSAGVLFSEKKPYVTFGGANNGWALTSAYVAGPILAEYVK